MSAKRCQRCGKAADAWHSFGRVCWECYQRENPPPPVRPFIPVDALLPAAVAVAVAVAADSPYPDPDP